MVPFANALGTQNFDRVRVYHGVGGTRLDVEQIIGALPNDTHLYCCGPNRMIDEAVAKTKHMKDRVHIEYFGGSIDPAQKSYDIHLAKTKQTIDVQKGQTMIEALRAANVDVQAHAKAASVWNVKRDSSRAIQNTRTSRCRKRSDANS